MMLFSQVYHSKIPNIILTIFFLISFITNCVISRSIDPDDLTIDKSEVPARYVFEIDEVQDELSEIDNIHPTSQDHLNSHLLFDMPIAVAVFAAVMLLICCFCCLRCAVTYDGFKRGGFYGRSEKGNVVDIARSLRSNDTIKK